MFEPNFKVKLDQGSDTYGGLLSNLWKLVMPYLVMRCPVLLSSFREPLVPVLLSTELSISSRLLRGCVRYCGVYPQY